MLCLTTRWVPWADSQLDERLRMVLDTHIEGIILSVEDPLDHWPQIVREIIGAQHSIPAATAPVPEKPFLPGRPPRLPQLDGLDESESRAALDSVLQSLSCARDLGIPALILTPPRLPGGSALQDLNRRHQDWIQKRQECEKSITQEDLESTAAAETRIAQLRGEYQRFLKQWEKSVPPLEKRRDSLLRNLDKILDEADRTQIQILLRESRQPHTPLQRGDWDELMQRFAGAPMKPLLDPAAEAWNRELRGCEFDPPAPFPDQGSAGMILANVTATGEETLPESGIFNPDLLFCNEGSPLQYPLHILDPAPGTAADLFPEASSYCRHKGFDGDPPPEPGEPWIIF